MMAAYTAWIVLLASAYFLLPGQRVVFWGLLALSGVFAIVAGVFLHQPAAPAAWLLLAAANLSFAIGQISFLVITEVRHESLTVPVSGRRLLPEHLPDLRGRAADLYPAPRGPAATGAACWTPSP